jgi:ABC-type amino acid transport substrate-binding protein
MFACANGHEQTAQLLLSRGANASIKSVKGSDARELALEYAHVDAVVSARIVAMLWKYERAAKAAAAGDKSEKPTSFFGSFW